MCSVLRATNRLTSANEYTLREIPDVVKVTCKTGRMAGALAYIEAKSRSGQSYFVTDFAHRLSETERNAEDLETGFRGVRAPWQSQYVLVQNTETQNWSSLSPRTRKQILHVYNYDWANDNFKLMEKLWPRLGGKAKQN